MKSWVVLPDRERAGLAGAADHASGLRREADEVLGLAAGRAGAERRREPGRDQQLQAEGERVGVRRLAGVGVQQRELVGRAG